jgi:flavin reductase (DIM6/NTAB) family NADH-FMN oxidoreductase RutF
MTEIGNDQGKIRELLKTAMRRLPGPVALITTRDPHGDHPAGLAASAVIPVSMDPPSMLVAVNRNASAHAAIERAGRFCVNLLDTTQTSFVDLFSNSQLRESRFHSDEWQYRDGIPFLSAACSNIFCKISKTLVFGTHELFVGEVYEICGEQREGAQPLGWIEGGFAQLGKLA